MAQFGRPSTDTTIGTYTDQAGGTTNIYGTIDEVSPANDADYIKSVANPANAVYVTKLTSVVDPQLSTGHIVRWRRGKDPASGGEQIDLTVELRQGYTNESSLGTLIASKTVNNIAAAFTDDSMTLSGAEADAITDYANLYLRFIFNKP